MNNALELQCSGSSFQTLCVRTTAVRISTQESAYCYMSKYEITNTVVRWFCNEYVGINKHIRKCVRIVVLSIMSAALLQYNMTKYPIKHPFKLLLGPDDYLSSESTNSFLGSGLKPISITYPWYFFVICSLNWVDNVGIYNDLDISLLVDKICS